MLVSFSAKSRGSYNRLEQAVNSGDYSLAHQIAHAERGAAQIIGAVRLTQLLAELEEALKGNSELNYGIMLDGYGAELDNVLDYTFSDVETNHWAFYDIMEAASTHDHEKTGKTET